MSGDNGLASDALHIQSAYLSVARFMSKLRTEGVCLPAIEEKLVRIVPTSVVLGEPAWKQANPDILRPHVQSWLHSSVVVAFECVTTRVIRQRLAEVSDVREDYDAAT